MTSSCAITLQPWPPLVLYVPTLCLSVSTGLPVHVSCHEFQTVDIGNSDNWLELPDCFVKLSHEPLGLLITNSGALSVSFHSSPGGVNSIAPIHVNTPNGFTLIALLAYGWSINVSSVYGNVIRSPVFW